jgi:translation initiation factor 2 subunit 3
MNCQPDLNIGTCGHVSEGKSTLIKSITGISPMRYKSEKIKNLTIKLGYANSIIYKCECQDYNAYKCNVKEKVCNLCGKNYTTQKNISFVDCPGHQSFMGTMLNGACLMDVALLVISANNKCPQPQTLEHLKALTVMNVNKIIILQNKIDLVSRDQAIHNLKEIKEFVKGTIAENSPIIPISAQLNININILLKHISNIENIKRDIDKSPRMIIVRSFDINNPNIEYQKIKGGVIGGSIIQGKLKIGDKITIKPGIKIGNDYKKISSEIISMRTDDTNLEEAKPGGLIGIELLIDPFLTSSDKLIGNFIELEENLDKEINSMILEYHQLKDSHKIKKNENIILNIYSANIQAKIISKYKTENKNFLTLSNFSKPVYTGEGENITILQRIENRNHLFGYGIVQKIN